MRRTLFACTLVFFCTFSFAQSSQPIANAAAFARMYGYVRYFHPSDEAASINWERFALYGMEKVKDCKDTKALQSTLQQLFQPIAPAVQVLQQNDAAAYNSSQLQVPDPSAFKIVAWQHIGVGVGGQGGLYRSLRTNRPAPVATGNRPNFAPVSTSIDARPWRGKVFVYTARVRMASGNGQVQLWARVDKDDKKMGFFDNMDDRPIRSAEWNRYEIRGIIDNDANKLYVGAFLRDKGQAELDDLSLKIKEGDEWKEVYAENFDTTEAGKKPAKLGFNYNSGYSFAVQKNGAEGYAAIRSLQEGEGPTQPHKQLFAALPLVGEVLEKNIGAGLKIQLPLALWGSTTQTFPAGDTTALRLLKEQLNAIKNSEINGDELTTRLADVAIAWNIFQHFFPYFDVVKVDWPQVLQQAIADAYTDKSAADFQHTLQRMTAQLHDGHVRVNWPGAQNNYLPPIKWEWVEDQLVITDVLDSSTSLRRGAVVTQINGEDPKQFFAPVYQRISAGTNGWLQYRANLDALLGAKDAVLKLEVAQGGVRSPITLQHTITLNNYYRFQPRLDSVKMLTPDVAYINLDIASMKAINNFLPQLKNSKAIICDLRGYPNDNHELLAYLLKEKDTSTRWMQVAQTLYPDREKQGWQYHSWGIKPAKTHLGAKIFFLIDGSAISYAESYMSFVEHYKLATIVGQPTAGANGNINPFSLPGGYSISWTGMRVVKHDGSTHHAVGIQPNVVVSKTVKGVREGRDEFLEKALELAQEK